MPNIHTLQWEQRYLLNPLLKNPCPSEIECMANSDDPIEISYQSHAAFHYRRVRVLRISINPAAANAPVAVAAGRMYLELSILFSESDFTASNSV